MNFAIVETGGKQYKIDQKTHIQIEKIKDIKKGDQIIFDKVLLMVEGDEVKIGQPYIADFSLQATVIENIKDKKIRILKYRAKSRYRRRAGHRQQLSQIGLNPSIVTKKETKKTKKVAKTSKK